MIRVRRAALPRSSNEAIGIVGGGNSAQALSAYLAERGFAPHIYIRDPSKLQDLQRTKLLKSSGAIEGLFAVPMVTTDPGEMMRACRTVFITTVATAYGDVARQLAPFVTSEHELIVFSSKLCGSLDLARSLEDLGAPRPALVVETDALFAARTQPDGSINIRGLKGWNLAATPAAEDLAEGAAVVQRFFPNVEQAVNLVHRGLSDFGILVHPLTMLANINKVDRAEAFPFYLEGFTQRTVVLLDTLEAELNTLANAYGATLLPARELLDRYYGCDTTGSLLDAMRSAKAYSKAVSPIQLDHRYMHEDVRCTLMPARELAQKAGLVTPMLDAVITLSTTLLGSAYFEHRRTLDFLGWGKLTAAQIRDRIGPRIAKAESVRPSATAAAS